MLMALTTNVLFLMKSFHWIQNMQITYREVYHYLPLMLSCGLLTHTANTAWTWALISVEIVMYQEKLYQEICNVIKTRSGQGHELFHAIFRCVHASL